MWGGQPSSGFGATRWGALLAVVVVVGSLALAPAPAPPSAAQGQRPPRLQSFELPSPLVDTSTPGGRLADGRTVPKVNVLLPDGYDDHPDRRFPVLWLLHGADGGADNWLPGITDLAAGFPGIVVMPDGGMFGMYADWWNGGERGAPAWATYHLQVLRQEIDDRYRIRPGRRWHAIAGISMGGQGALRYAAMLPGYFGSVAAFSAALPDMQSEAAQTLLDAGIGGGTTYETIFGPAAGAYAEGNSPQALAANYSHTRLYLTSGDGTNCPQDPVNPDSIAFDIAIETTLNAQQEPFAAAARAAGVDATAVTTCGVHTFGVWDRAFAAARDWGFFEEVPEQPPSWTYRTVATAGEMWGLRFDFAEPPAAVTEFTHADPTLTAAGTGRVDIRGEQDCELTATLPFERPLPAACQPRPPSDARRSNAPLIATAAVTAILATLTLLALTRRRRSQAGPILR